MKQPPWFVVALALIHGLLSLEYNITILRCVIRNDIHILQVFGSRCGDSCRSSYVPVTGHDRNFRSREQTPSGSKAHSPFLAVSSPFYVLIRYRSWKGTCYISVYIYQYQSYFYPMCPRSSESVPYNISGRIWESPENSQILMYLLLCTIDCTHHGDNCGNEENKPI